MLYEIGVRSDSCCPRCGTGDTYILHMLWECSATGQFWTDVLSLIHRVYGVTLPTQPKTCIMDLIGDVAEPMPRFPGISRMLFQAWKLLALHWIQSSPASISENINRLNHIICEYGVRG